MPASSLLLLPPKDLASLIAAAVLRDTRGVVLTDQQRMNFFPATPLITVTRIFHGQLHMAQDICRVDDIKKKCPLPPISAKLPSDAPTVSWSPSEITALTVAIYPDAWTQLTGQPDCTSIPTALSNVLARIDPAAIIEAEFQQMCHDLVPFWQNNRAASPFSDWIGSDKIVDWTRHIVSRSISKQRGRSTRSVERLLRQLTGRSKTSLEFYAKLENLHREREKAPELNLADTALAANFSDQSHMGRALKRATGFSPADLNRRIECEESFWCYRLLGTRF